MDGRILLTLLLWGLIAALAAVLWANARSRREERREGLEARARLSRLLDAKAEITPADLRTALAGMPVSQYNGEVAHLTRLAIKRIREQPRRAHEEHRERPDPPSGSWFDFDQIDSEGLNLELSSRARDFDQIRAGWQVHFRDGPELGPVAEVANNYLLVDHEPTPEKRERLQIPASDIIAVETRLKAVYLTVTKAEFELGAREVAWRPT